MKINKLFCFAALATLLVFGSKATAQDGSKHVLNTLRLEARADLQMTDYLNTTSRTDYGFVGKYFNIHAGGQIGEKFSYYFRHRIIANGGTSNLFENTDFLHLTYKMNDNWSFRAGKDALAVGGFEYDAAPIDVFYNGIYWDNFYCFQFMSRAIYKTNDGNHSFMAEIGGSPYLNWLGMGDNAWKEGLMSYNLFWSGNFDHFKTLYSVNFFEYSRGNFMNYIALGNKLEYDNWGIYLDLMHHSFASDDWGRNFGIVSRFDYTLSDSWKFFLKGSYEANRSNYAFNMPGTWDCLVLEHHAYCLMGGGFEFRPSSSKAVRVHGLVAYREETDYTPVAPNLTVENPNPIMSSSLIVNVGLSWNMDFTKLKK